MVLFDKSHKVTKDEVRERLKNYVDRAKLGFDILKEDPRSAIQIGESIRKELKEEYVFYKLKRNEDLDKEEYFNEYEAAVTDILASISGNLTKKNISSFLYDVESYMEYWKAESKYKDDEE